MILIKNIKLYPGLGEGILKGLSARILRVEVQDIRQLKIVRKSLDARKKSDICWYYSVAVQCRGDEAALIARARGACSLYSPFKYDIPKCVSRQRPVVVGFGPAGMFAAFVLARAGLRPIVLERGCDADTRREKVEHFWQTGELDETGNVQFGEGGAGLFSDGKLNTNTHDPRMAWVLQQLHLHGAPENVCYDAKPHVGTDVLHDVVKSMREHITVMGGEIRPLSKLTGIDTRDGRVCAAQVQHGAERYTLACDTLILAVGHSARDTFEMLRDMGVPMEPKAFSMGVRIEHSQKRVSECQYRQSAPKLPPADYKLNCVLPDGASAYTFCMCPGGYVVAASSESGGVVTNGMSLSDRGGENANAALLVTLTPEDFPDRENVLSGMYWQREIEQKCFAYGGGDYRAPAQRVSDFLSHTASTGAGAVTPTYKPGVVWGELRDVLPKKLTDTLAAAIPRLGEKLPFFCDGDGVLTAPETRSSSPVRILRGDSFCSTVDGLYPCGEGAGYAGGITSAAVDGMRCAEAVIAREQAQSSAF